MALAVALMASGCATTTRRLFWASRTPAAPVGSVPVDPQGTGGHRERTTTSTAAPSGLTDCPATRLRARAALTGGGMGRRYATVELVNQGPGRCGVAGFVGVQLYDQGGQPLPTQVVRTTDGTDPVVLAQGGSAWATLSWSVVPGAGDSGTYPCQPATASLGIEVPGVGGRLRATLAAGPVCAGGRLVVGPLTSRPQV